ncbi:hypothetical protein TELCIR_12097 [Teladorsagia circumcincta]|uniref:Uncharacterized protein n=1 Tax=Teladorsagia circumcincta TaxID=45464 RepID=A0A2G9U7M8_TELCI|nr:hypothetical protein TELCIR_12097 [Teladorsagia circumcincta]
MGEEGTPLAIVDRLTTQDQQTALRFAFFNALLFVLTGICFCCLFALYKMMYMFLSPMLWAVLVGTVLFPFKKKVTNVVQGYLTHLQETNTPLVVGVMATPVCALKSFSEKVYSTAIRIYVLSSISLYFGVFKAAVFSACAVVLGLLSSGAWSVDVPQSPDAEFDKEVFIETESETAKLIDTPHEDGSRSGLFSTIGGAVESLWNRVYPPLKQVVDISVAGPLRKFVKVLMSL